MLNLAVWYLTAPNATDRLNRLRAQRIIKRYQYRIVTMNPVLIITLNITLLELIIPAATADILKQLLLIPTFAHTVPTIQTAAIL